MTPTERKSLACFKKNFQNFQRFSDKDKYIFSEMSDISVRLDYYSEVLEKRRILRRFR